MREPSLSPVRIPHHTHHQPSPNPCSQQDLHNGLRKLGRWKKKEKSKMGHGIGGPLLLTPWISLPGAQCAPHSSPLNSFRLPSRAFNAPADFYFVIAGYLWLVLLSAPSVLWSLLAHTPQADLAQHFGFSRLLKTHAENAALITPRSHANSVIDLNPPNKRLFKPAFCRSIGRRLFICGLWGKRLLEAYPTPTW